jgi:hypothetical protein
MENISYAMVTSLVVGIARAWELIGERDTGLVASVAALTGRTSSPAAGDSPDAGIGQAAPVSPRSAGVRDDDSRPGPPRPDRQGQ